MVQSLLSLEKNNRSRKSNQPILTAANIARLLWDLQRSSRFLGESLREILVSEHFSKNQRRAVRDVFESFQQCENRDAGRMGDIYANI